MNGLRSLTIGGAVLASLALGCSGSSSPAATQWEVYAVRYGTVRDFPVWALVTGADSTRRQDIAMMFWVLRSPGRTVLVDAGFYRQKYLDNWKPVDFIRPPEALARFGIDPGSVSDVILTHVHWDHMGGADLFDGAKVWIQRDEFEYYVNPDGSPAYPAIDTVHAKVLAGMHRAGRLVLIDGDGREIIPGITVYTGGKHTFASQYVGVRSGGETIVVASDNAYLYENLERGRPIAQTLDSTSNLAAQARMKELASATRLIVPGHDPDVFERFASAGEGVVRVQ